MEILPLLVEIPRSNAKTQKSVSGIQTLPLVMIDKKTPFSQNSVILQYFRKKLSQKCPFLKILDAALKF